MKAMVLQEFGGPEGFRWKDWPTPEPKAGEVRIRVKAVSVNPVDYKMRKGLISVPLPEVLGRDVAGTVDAVGEGVTEFAVGDEVTAVLFGPRSNGAYAQYVSTPEAFVSLKPKGISDTQAAVLGVAGLTAYDAVVRKAAVQPHEYVFVAGGSGGVGSFAISLLHSCNPSSILVTAGSDKSANYLNQVLGVPLKHIFHYRTMTPKQIETRVRDLTDGHGAHVAFDFVGGEMKKLCFGLTGFDGRVVSTVEEPPGFDFDIWQAQTSPFFAKSGSYHFVALSARARNGGPRDWWIYRDSMSKLKSLIEEGKVLLPKVTDLGEITEKSIREAHATLEDGHVQGKLALRMP